MVGVLVFILVFITFVFHSPEVLTDYMPQKILLLRNLNDAWITMGPGRFSIFVNLKQRNFSKYLISPLKTFLI